MNVDGLSESTLEKIINKNLLHSVLDLYRLKDHRDVLVKMDGFGEKSFENLVSSIEQSKQVPLANALYALGIKGNRSQYGKTDCKTVSWSVTGF